MRLNFSCYKYYTFSPVVEIFSNSSKFAGIYKTSWRKLKGFCSRSYSVILIVILIIRYAEAITRVAYVFDRIQRNAYLVSLSRISSWFRVCPDRGDRKPVVYASVIYSHILERPIP